MPRKSLDEKVKGSLIAPKIPADWTASDTQALRIWLGTRTGQKFFAAIRNLTSDSALQAAYAPADQVVNFSNVAKGMYQCFYWLCSLSGTDPLRVVEQIGHGALTESGEQTETDEEDQEQKPDQDREPTFGPDANPGSPIMP